MALSITLDRPQGREQVAAMGAVKEVTGASVEVGFVLLPRCRLVDRSVAWAARFRRLAKDCERLPETVVGLHFVAFACLMLHRLPTTVAA